MKILIGQHSRDSHKRLEFERFLASCRGREFPYNVNGLFKSSVGRRVSCNKVRIYAVHAKQRARILGNFKFKQANDDSRFYSGNSSQQIPSGQKSVKCTANVNKL